MSVFDGVPEYNMLQLKKRTLNNYKIEVFNKIRELELHSREEWEKAHKDILIKEELKEGGDKAWKAERITRLKEVRAMAKGNILACVWIMEEMEKIFKDITHDVPERG